MKLGETMPITYNTESVEHFDRLNTSQCTAFKLFTFNSFGVGRALYLSSLQFHWGLFMFNSFGVVSKYPEVLKSV